MKVKVIINSCVIVVCFAFFSCSQDEEVFSCNKEVNAWVKENLADIRQMGREDWLRLDENLKRGTYVAFDPEQKQTFWLQKTQEVLLLDWSEAEKEHLELLYQTILNNPIWFSKDRTEKEYEEYDLFQYKWVEYAVEKLVWTPEQVGAIVSTGNKVLNKEGGIQINNAGSRLKSASESNCNCNSSLGNMYNECGSQYKHCSTQSSCIGSSWGCSPLLLGKCDGLCKDN
jgi:hypothetical protein